MSRLAAASARQDKEESLREDSEEVIISRIWDNHGKEVGYEQKGILVRCKNCKHHEELLNNNDGNVICWVHGIDVIVDRNGYCNYGEKEEQEHES